RPAAPPIMGARPPHPGFGDVNYNRGSEPYLKIALLGNRPSVGAVIAEVNLKLIWEVISAIKVGETGFAFVLDQPGRLIAHTDLSLVLRGAEQAPPKPFQVIREAIGRAGVGSATAMDLNGQMIAAAAAPVH